mmetsp:Transcript_13218/g.40068  ORF Transcript_13218/g.40068 Transcript_13218/m.40068 type:complete len:218 (+) Transcript_13218:63-716(+)
MTQCIAGDECVSNTVLGVYYESEQRTAAHMIQMQLTHLIVNSMFVCSQYSTPDNARAPAHVGTDKPTRNTPARLKNVASPLRGFSLVICCVCAYAFVTTNQERITKQATCGTTALMPIQMPTELIWNKELESKSELRHSSMDRPSTRPFEAAKPRFRQLPRAVTVLQLSCVETEEACMSCLYKSPVRVLACCRSAEGGADGGAQPEVESEATTQRRW